MVSSKHIQRRFENSAVSFDSADFVHAATRDGLLARIEPLLLQASTVVDLGAATGASSRLLNKRFPKARVIAVDIAHNMLREARRSKSWLAKTSFAQADASSLPFANESVDVIFCNQMLPLFENPDPVLIEVARVLKKGGVFAFATLGPDSLQEINQAWRQVDNGTHVNRFPDMHDLGDGLVNAGLADPVLDVDRLAVTYKTAADLFKDLTHSGARNTLPTRQATLTGTARFSAMTEALENAANGGDIVLNLELVYGHCWGQGPKMDPSNYRIDAGAIPIRRK